ncbi:MAG TPA: polysaccharide deacetylase family protein [Baekduia sp.]|jgi:peptidoglycan/xylan/chitin deacetylase (PgdA/CDA1 family)
MKRTNLALTPTPVLLAKAALTRARSLRWSVVHRRPADGLRILCYHRIADEPDPLAVTPARFAAQMAQLDGAGLRALDVESAVAHAGNGGAAGVVGLSFDDGYADVAGSALGVLERLGFRATVFLPTGVIDHTATLSWYAHPPPMLAWDQIADLDRAGTLRFGAHTVTHPILTTLDAPTARAEIAGSKSTLEAHLGHTASAFCYPAGLFGARERALVAQAGFRLATSCEPGINTALTDPLALRRIQVDHRDSLMDFRAKVGGGFDTPSPTRAAYRRLRFGAAASSPS